MRLIPSNKKHAIGTHRSLLQLLGASRLASSNKIPTIFEAHGYQPLFIRASTVQATSLDTNKWRIWTQKQAFRGVASPASYKDSTNVVPFAKPERFASDNYFAQELLDKLDSYENTEKAAQLRFTPNFGMSKQRNDEPLYVPPAPRPRGMFVP